MKRTITFLLTKMFAAMIVAAMIVSSAAAQETVWFSTSNTAPGAPPTNGNNTLNITGAVNSTATLYIWSTNATPDAITPGTSYPAGSPAFPTNVPPTSAYFAYDLTTTGAGSAGAFSITAAQIYNPNVLTAGGASQTGDQNWAFQGSAGPTDQTVTRWNASSSFLVANASNISTTTNNTYVTGLDASALPVALHPSGNLDSAINTNIHTGLATPVAASDPFYLTSAQNGGNGAAFLVGEVKFNINALTSATISLGVSNSATSPAGNPFLVGTNTSVQNGTTWAAGTPANTSIFNNNGSTANGSFAATTGTATLNITNSSPARRGDLNNDTAVNALDIDQLMSDVKNGLTYGQASALGRNDNVTLASVLPTDPVSTSQVDFEVGELVDHNGDTSVGTGNGVGLSDPTHPKGTHYGNISLTGTVNFGDLQTVIGAFNTAVPGTSFWENGNFSFTGTVNFGDLQTTIGNFNVSGPGPAPLPGVSPVPEPTSIVLFGLGGIIGGLALRRRRKS